MESFIGWTDWFAALGLVLFWWLGKVVAAPFLGGYATEKGKRLATAEDLEKILAEVQAVTTETEQIKAAISSDVWYRQWRLDKKIETYQGVFRSLNHLLRIVDDALSIEHDNRPVVVHEEVDRLRDALTDFRIDVVWAAVMLSETAQKALEPVSKWKPGQSTRAGLEIDGSIQPPLNRREELEAFSRVLKRSTIALIEVARQELDGPMAGRTA